MENNFVVLLRFFAEKGELDKLIQCVDMVLNLNPKAVIILINSEEDNSDALAYKWPEKVEIHPVSPWSYPLSLNAGIKYAIQYIKDGAEVLVVSTEIQMGKEALDKMFELLTPDVIAVGAALPGHDWSPGVYDDATGTQIPWHTCVLLRGYIASVIGYAPVSLIGVEEWPFYLFAQTIMGRDNAKVMLAKLPGVVWDVPTTGPRAEKHKIKMVTKNERVSSLKHEWQMIMGALRCKVQVHHVEENATARLY